MVTHPSSSCRKARTPLTGIFARRIIPIVGLMVALCGTAIPASAQEEGNVTNREPLKWMPRRPVTQFSQEPASQTPKEVVQTQALSVDTEPTIDVAPRRVEQRMTRPQTRVAVQSTAQPEAKIPTPPPAPTVGQSRVPNVRSTSPTPVRSNAVPQNIPAPQAGPVEYVPGSVFADDGVDGDGGAYWDAGDTWGDPCRGRSCGFRPGFGLMRWLATPNPTYGRIEAMLLWGKGMHVPALATTSPDGTARAQAGVLGQEGTSVLFGQTNLANTSRIAGRWSLGRWFDCNQTTGLEVSYLTTETDTSGYFATSAGTTIIARPFYNVDTGEQDARLISYSGVSDGSIDVYARSRLDGLDVTMRHGLFWDSNRRLDFMVGYRYMQLKDVFRTHEATFSTDTSGLVPVGTATSIYDLFDTKNEFNGANLGFAGRMQYNRWSMDLLMKLGIGNTRSRVNLQGSSTVTTPDGTVASYESGLLVLDSNKEAITHNQFTMIPEIGVNLGYDLTPRMRATVGYSLIYWSHVARAGDQVNLDLNPNEFQSTSWTGAAIPRETFVVNDYWIQGLNIGLDMRF